MIEDIKREDHCNVSKPLQHRTAKAINGALMQAQGLGIPAIPDVDAIICQLRRKEVVCELIGKEVYALTQGVCANVGGIGFHACYADNRFISDIDLLVWDEECPDSCPEADYDQWEDLRRQKTQVALQILGSRGGVAPEVVAKIATELSPWLDGRGTKPF
ncbi:MAG: hypothetical protein WA376_14500 [Terrimicrobiaceae bacterium]